MLYLSFPFNSLGDLRVAFLCAFLILEAGVFLDVPVRSITFFAFTMIITRDGTMMCCDLKLI